MKNNSGSTKPIRTVTASPAALATALTATSSEPWQIAPHFALLNAELLDLAAGKTKGLIITLPPQNGKSTFVTQYFSAWYLNTFPDKRILFASYEADYASDWLVKVRDTIRHNPDVFDIQLANASRKRFNIAGRKGGMQSSGVGGSLTGKSGDIMIIDDPIKNSEEASSSVIREKVDNWFRSVVTTRLSPDGFVIIIMTRWHHDDLVGRIVKRMKEGGRQYKVVSLPAVSEEGIPDSLNRSYGVPLWPRRYPLDWLKLQRVDVGPYFWSAQYQQKPTSVEQQIIKPDWWKFYSYHDGDESLLPHPRFILQAWDTAFKTSESNDYSVCLTWYVTENGFYVVDFLRERLSFPRLKTECINRAARWKPNLILVEDKASGQSLVQTMRAETHLPIRPSTPVSDKPQRLHMQSGYWEAGKIFLPEGASWTQTILDEFNDFPRGAFDDIVDTFSMSVEHLRSRLRLVQSGSQPTHQSTPTQADRQPRNSRRDSSFLKGFG